MCGAKVALVLFPAALILLSTLSAQPLPVHPLNFTTTVEVNSTVKVDSSGNARIETRMKISASREFNLALERQLSRLEEERDKVIRRLKAALVLLGYDAEEVDIRREGSTLIYTLRIKNFATRLNDTWIIEPRSGLQPLKAPLTTFTSYNVRQELIFLLPRGAEVLMVSPLPFERQVDSAKVRLNVQVSHDYLTEVRYTYSAELPPGASLSMLAEQEPVRIIYTYTPPPFSSPAYLALSVLIILASISVAYRMKAK